MSPVLYLFLLTLSVIFLPPISCRSLRKKPLDECPCKLTKPQKVVHIKGQEEPAGGLGSKIRDVLDRTTIYLKCKSEVEAGCLATKDFIGCYFKCEQSCKFIAGIDVEIESSDESSESEEQSEEKLDD